MALHQTVQLENKSGVQMEQEIVVTLTAQMYCVVLITIPRVLQAVQTLQVVLFLQAVQAVVLADVG